MFYYLQQFPISEEDRLMQMEEWSLLPEMWHMSVTHEEMRVDSHCIQSTDDLPSPGVKSKPCASIETASEPDLFAAVERFFSEEGVDYSLDRRTGKVLAAIPGKGEKLTCKAEIDAIERLLIFYTVEQVEMPKAYHTELLYLVNSLNTINLIGNFEVDFTLSEVRYRTALDLAEIPDSVLDACVDGLLTNTVYANIAMMTEAIKFLKLVASGVSSASQAICQI
jgi:hypothetical protein